MFSIFNKPKPKGKIITLQIDGMHCTSCSLNIDGSLEDLDGVIEAKTSYAKSQTTIEYDPQKINQEQIEKNIQETGYTIKNNNKSSN
jgi:Cu+-exporting ATPase